ncbi:protein phosphatase CheZ [Nitrosomonas mobilis]|uniref:protein phosphatase CheZ n=1 Tax=Nitrosomonas mobilis TaxID=51642 RepID=UPI000B7FCF74|nr:protein phosphatase CheZ [Nitrosomonas mobilis]HNO74358.1 protein phosphatase CheZ [Nitrosomonas mobilis]
MALTQIIDFLSEISKKSGLTRQCLTEVLIAQSHQDLVGQVTQKLLQTFETLGQQLQQLPTKKSVSTKTGGTKQATWLIKRIGHSSYKTNRYPGQLESG